MRELAKRLAIFEKDLNDQSKSRYEVDEESIEYFHGLLEDPKDIYNTIFFLEDVLLNDPAAWSDIDMAIRIIQMLRELKLLYAYQMGQKEFKKKGGAQDEKGDRIYR